MISSCGLPFDPLCEREVDEVRARVDRDRVRFGREKCLAELREAVRVLGEDRDDAALGRDVEAAE